MATITGAAVRWPRAWISEEPPTTGPTRPSSKTFQQDLAQGSILFSHNVTKVQINVQRLDAEADLPVAQHSGDAGYDLCARESITLAACGGRGLVGTGIAIGIPDGFAGFIQPRSGLALRHGVTCLNTPGLIDSGYRDEIKVLLINTDPIKDYVVEVGDRIAQLVIQRFESIEWIEVSNLDESERSLEGWGSTGR